MIYDEKLEDKNKLLKYNGKESNIRNLMNLAIIVAALGYQDDYFVDVDYRLDCKVKFGENDFIYINCYEEICVDEMNEDFSIEKLDYPPSKIQEKITFVFSIMYGDEPAFDLLEPVILYYFNVKNLDELDFLFTNNSEKLIKYIKNYRMFCEICFDLEEKYLKRIEIEDVNYLKKFLNKYADINTKNQIKKLLYK